MKKTLLLIALFCFGLAASAQNEIYFNSSSDGLKILESGPAYLKVKLSLSGIKTRQVQSPEGSFTEILTEGFSKIYLPGQPQLPVYTQLFHLPYGANARINIVGYEEEVVQLSSYGINTPLIPAQASVSKSTPAAEVPFVRDQQIYNSNQYHGMQTASIEENGTIRGLRMGTLTLSPFSYNPVQNSLKLKNHLIVEIFFDNADLALTEQMKEKYYSPAFEGVYHRMINYTPPASKDVISKYPIKYVIVSHSMFQSALQPFVQWKTRKGFTVVEQYYSSAPATATIKSFLENLYNAGTPGDPAPTYVLFVGDVAQIPANTGQTDTHPTDLYYCTFDGSSDYLPDMYYGRFSATSVGELQPQIDKTLEYEQYLMPNPSYLDTVVMIGGVDNNYASVWANGQINYGTTNYFNSAHGIYSYTHLYPASGNEDAIIRAEMSRGVGYANYTAHGGETSWADPNFNTTHVSAMTNAHKYGLMVGNCCITNTFNFSSPCLGEALLRAANKGALGYIGASNNSYWDEDYYWGVGKRSNIVVNPTYDASNLGAYDVTFHDHGEPKSSWFITQGQMIHGGNLAVQSSSSSLKQYYWEIYHLMGDPSVMIYFSVPDAMTVQYNDPITVGETSLTVTAEEDAYVAISHNNVLLDAQLAGPSGVVTLNFPAFVAPDTADIVVTKQNREPYIGTVSIIAMNIPLDAQMLNIVRPRGTYPCSGVNEQPIVVLRNMGTTVLSSCVITYQIQGGSSQQYNWSGSLATFATDTVALPAILLPPGTHTFTASVSQPNSGTDGNAANNSFSADFTAATAPIVSDFSADFTQFCAAPGTVQFTDLSSNASGWQWNFGDGNSSNLQHPSHTYSSNGVYTVSLSISAGACGGDQKTVQGFVTVGANPPLVSDGSHCGAGAVTLQAAGSGIISWYDALTGGNLVGSGSSYTTPGLSTSTTYYVQQTLVMPDDSVGKYNNFGTGAYHTNTSYWLVFDCYAPVVLKEVTVYANSTGNRTIVLRNSGGTVLQSTTVNFGSGTHTIPLNFNIPVGNNLQLALAQGSTTGLWRSADDNISYPYNLAGKISITGSNTTSLRYYFFYNWKIAGDSCESALVPATAVITAAAPDAQFSYTYGGGTTINFANNSIDGASYSWDFGDGSTSTVKDAVHTFPGSGMYTVTLIAHNDCGSDTIVQGVNVVISAVNEESFSDVQIFPNPAGDMVSVDFGGIRPERLYLSDAAGRMLREITGFTADQTMISLSSLQSGIYFLRIEAKNGTGTYRILHY